MRERGCLKKIGHKIMQEKNRMDKYNIGKNDNKKYKAHVRNNVNKAPLLK